MIPIDTIVPIVVAVHEANTTSLFSRPSHSAR
uniref:Uncharacterized protein n=1 Tax=Ralstonia syzygii R24 TaxID=907261 RepID=G3A1N5_9RALS|nr:hypothetical protein RALSY_11138 [Ralstonia syzygii R24]